MKILTFDIEDWFHILDHASTRTYAEWAGYPSRIEEGVARILDCCDRHRVRATFFCLGWIARSHPAVVRAIVERGHEVGSHSDMHQLVYEQSAAEFAADLTRSIRTLEDVTGQRIRSYRAPGFSITADNLWAFDALIKAGIEVDASVFPAGRAHGGLADYGPARPSIIERRGGTLRSFPINTRMVIGQPVIFSGGGYFRLAPLPLLRRWFRDADYVMTYFHPRDFDPDQPVLGDLGAARRFKSYVGLGSAMGKLDVILSENAVMSLGEAEARVDWKRVPRVKLEGKSHARHAA